MSKDTYLTKDQFTKLGCDAHACFEVASMTETRINGGQYHPMSTAGISLATAMMTILGLSLELKLKTLYYNQYLRQNKLNK